MIENTIAPYRVDGKIIGAIGTAIDVTASRTLERRMVDAQRAESLGVLAGGLAHDFNNLLVAILGNADLGLRDTLPGTPGHTALENIRDAGLRAAELTDQLLAYAGRGSVSSARVAAGASGRRSCCGSRRRRCPPTSTSGSRSPTTSRSAATPRRSARCCST